MRILFTILFALALMSSCAVNGTHMGYSHPTKTFDEFVTDVNEVDTHAFMSRGSIWYTIPAAQYDNAISDGMKIRGYTSHSMYRLPKSVQRTEYMPPSDYRCVYWLDNGDIDRLLSVGYQP